MKRTGGEIAKIRARKDADFEAGVWNGILFEPARYGSAFAES